MVHGGVFRRHSKKRAVTAKDAARFMRDAMHPVQIFVIGHRVVMGRIWFADIVGGGDVTTMSTEPLCISFMPSRQSIR